MPVRSLTIPRLRDLAFRKGFEVERARMRGCWRLLDRDGAAATAPNGTQAFTLAEARMFLAARPDA